MDNRHNQEVKSRERNRNSEIFWMNVEMELRNREVRWQQFAENLNIDRSTIASMKSRSSRLSLDTAIRVSQNLGVTIDYLLQDPYEHRRHYNGLSLPDDEFEILSGYKAVKNKSYYTANAVRNLIMGIINQFRKEPIPDGETTV